MIKDGVPFKDLLLTCSITLIEQNAPTETFVLELDRVSHCNCLVQWLTHVDEIWGMNFLYDLVFLRTIPAFRRCLDGRQRIVDMGILNYLQSELRPERSLKNIGPILGLWSYEEEIKQRRFELWEDLKKYNAEDTWNTARGVIELRSRISEQFPSTDKDSEWSRMFYSDLIWSVVHLSESGVAFNESKLKSLSDRCTAKIDRAFKIGKGRGLTLHLEGANISKRALINRIVTDHPEVKGDIMLKLTEKTREISFGSQNRKLIAQLTPATSPYRKDFKLMEIHGRAHKLRSTYLKPLKEVHLVSNGTTCSYCYPSWHLFPGPFKDGAGSSGGTQQGRITATYPPLQTNPREIKACFGSRHGEKGAIVNGDLSQIELRVPGILSGEPSFINAYAAGADLHSERAVAVFGEECRQNPNFHSGDNLSDPRQHAKQFNFADLYRAGPKKLRELLLDECGVLLGWDVVSAVVKDRPRLRPVFYAWQEGLLAHAEKWGYLHLPFTGQSRYLDHEDDHNAILNFPIQTTAGNVLHRWKHYIIPRLPVGARLFADVYDAVMIDCLADQVGEVTGILEDGIHWLQTEDYWAKLQSHYGHEVPLAAETHCIYTRDTTP